MADKNIISANNVPGANASDDKAQNYGGQGAYGMVHVMEEQMKDAGTGTFGDAEEAPAAKRAAKAADSK
jgi:hypothetical protein